jgi:hypothetical protein
MYSVRASSVSPSEVRDNDDDRVLKQSLSDCEDSERAVKLMTDETLENVIMDDLLHKWTRAQWHHR